MKFAELLNKITVCGENQTASQEKSKKANTLASKAKNELAFQSNKEKDVQCYVNGRKRNNKKEKDTKGE